MEGLRSRNPNIGKYKNMTNLLQARGERAVRSKLRGVLRKTPRANGKPKKSVRWSDPLVEVRYNNSKNRTPSPNGRRNNMLEKYENELNRLKNVLARTARNAKTINSRVKTTPNRELFLPNGWAFANNGTRYYKDWRTRTLSPGRQATRIPPELRGPPVLYAPGPLAMHKMQTRQGWA
jgi:hypothetical protein